MKHCNLTIVLLFLLMGIKSSFATPAFYAVSWSDAGTEIRKNNIPVYGILGDQALISLENGVVNRLMNSNFKMILLDQVTTLNEYYLVGKRDKNKSVLLNKNINVLLKSGDSYLIKGKTGLTEIYRQNFDVLSLGTQPMVLPPAEKLIAPVIKAENKNQPITDLISQVRPDSVLSYLKYLQSMQTRFAHAENHRDVAEKIRLKFIALGCSNAVLDSFFVPAYTNAYGLDLSDSWQYNIVATITGAESPNDYILITGHYDTITDSNVSGQNPFITAPGIDDNGTSVAAEWEICRVLKSNNLNHKKSIRFIAFAIEESGLLGSKNYAQKAYDSGMQISGVINNDMIGYNTMPQESWIIRIMPYTGSEGFNNLTKYITNLYTSLDARIDSQNNSAGSDSHSFYTKGYQASYFFEKEKTPYYHSNGDTWEHVDPLYCSEVIKSTFALALHKSEAPDDIAGLQIQDQGSGNQLMGKWRKSNALNIANYKLYWGTTSGEYSNSINLNDTVSTINGLSNNQMYYIGVSVVTTSNFESMIIEGTGTPRLVPLAPKNLSTEPQLLGIKLDWTANIEPDIAGYNVYRSLNDIDYTKINQSLITGLSYDDNIAESNYYFYKISAVDSTNNESELGNSSTSRPVTLNQGILIVDESANGSGSLSSPDDSMQDQFFNSLLTNCPQVSSYDANSSDKITLSELGPFSTVIWHNQSVELGSVFSRYHDEIKKYLDFGGKILITADKPGKLIESINTYPADCSSTSLAEQYFGIDSVYYKVPSRFSGAIPSATGFNYLTVDSSKALADCNYHLKKIETLKAKPDAEVIYLYDSKYDSNINYGFSKNQPVGILHSGTNFKTATLSIPLYFIKQNEAKKVVEYILKEKFGETVDIHTNQLISEKSLSLFQNYPNPFNNTTLISFALPNTGKAELTVYNAKGELVKELVNREMSAGKHSLEFKADNLNSGVYFYRLKFAGRTLESKLVLIK